MGDRGVKQAQDVVGRAEAMVERLASLGDLTLRKMFGGVGIFDGASMFAMVTSKGEFRLKVGDGNRERFERAGCESMGRMPYFTVPAEVMDSDSTLLEWAATSLAEAHRVKTGGTK